jgi:hypothetical protein
MTSIVSWANGTYLCYTVARAPGLDDETGRAAEAWATALFYLMQGQKNGPPSFQGIVGWPMDHSRFVPYDISWYPKVGQPTALAAVNKGTTNNPYCYVRQYDTGLVALNASLAAPPPATNLGCQFTIPSGSGAWTDQFGSTTDQYGNTYTPGNTYTLPPVGTTGGCQTAVGHTASGLTCSAVVLQKS